MRKNVKWIGVLMAVIIAFSVFAAGCGKDETEKLVPSDLDGAQVLNEFWNPNLDESAEYLNGYRAQSLEEVTRNWRQAKMQGNGAILYSIYSKENKELFLLKMKNEFGIWNFYFGKENEKPINVTCSTPQPIEDIDNLYYSTITTIKSDGVTTTTQDIYIEVVDGGYFVTSYTAEEVVE